MVVTPLLAESSLRYRPLIWKYLGKNKKTHYKNKSNHLHHSLLNKHISHHTNLSTEGIRMFLSVFGFHTFVRKPQNGVSNCSKWQSQVMMTSSNGSIFREAGSLCGEFTGPGEFPKQRPVTRNFAVFFDLRPNKWLSKQPWGWWFETLSWSLWRQCNIFIDCGPSRGNMHHGCMISTFSQDYMVYQVSVALRNLILQCRPDEGSIVKMVD